MGQGGARACLSRRPPRRGRHRSERAGRPTRRTGSARCAYACRRRTGDSMTDIVMARPRAARVATWVFFTLNGFAVGLWVVHIPVIERAVDIQHSTLGFLLLLLGGSAFIGMQVAGP